MWEDEQYIYPRFSQWFGVLDAEGNEVPLKEQTMYKEDWVGLRTLYESGRLFFYSGPGKHMYKTQAMINKFLAPLLLGENPLPS